MIVPVKNGGKVKVLNVFLDPTSDSTEKEFHCPVCGKVVFHYYNPLHSIMTGDQELPTDKPLEIMCGGRVTKHDTYGRVIREVSCKTIFKVQ